MHAWRTIAMGLAVGGLLGAGSARAGTETFDNTGLSNNWVAAGSFTGGVSGVAWTFANARGIPRIYADNPAITLRTDNAATNKGWLLSSALTGGVGRISATFMQASATTSDCIVRVNDIVVGNFKSSGVSGIVEVASYDAFDPVSRMPFTNDFTLMVSNRLATAGRVALDDLAWEPFRLFVRLDKTGTNLAYAGQEFDVTNEVYSVGQAVSGGWQITPAFAGTASDTNEPHLTLIPATADIGKTFELAYEATDAEGTGYAHRASCWMEVLEAPNPRFVDFETASFGYDTNSGVTTNLNGMPWLFFNVQTSDATDTRIGTTSARFRHSSLAAPASMESLETFEGVGAISVHGAYYQSNRVVTVAVLTKGEDEGAVWATNGLFSVENQADITNGVFSFEVQRAEPVFVKLVTTGNFDQRANLDDLRASEYGDVPPRLAWNGSTNVPVGWETVLDFTLLNAEGIVRTWEASLSPSNANAAFEVLPDQNLRLRFSPADAGEWGDYAVAVTAHFDAVVAGATNFAIRVVSPPTFALAPVATNVAVREIVDVWVTNVALHGAGTNWTTAWSAVPAFFHDPSVSDKRRFRIKDGTEESDVGAHALAAVLTDAGTGVRATNAVSIVVAAGGGDLTNEVYSILSFQPTQLVVGGKSGRVFWAFGTTNLAATNGFWQGTPVTNVDGADLALDITNAPDPRLFFYGVKVRAAP